MEFLLHPSSPGEDYTLSQTISFGRSSDIRVKETVTYIVAGLIYRRNNGELQILLIQEAKASCHGKWYLPAGRVEAGESLEEGLKREVLEEAGVDAQPQRVTRVEGARGWFRFTFLCRMRDEEGPLKSTAEADEESLQASWFPVQHILDHKIPIRANDIVPLIMEGAERFEKNELGALELHPTPLRSMYLRFLILDETNHRVCVTKEKSELPIVEFPLSSWPSAVIFKFCAKVFLRGSSVMQPNWRCLRVEAFPKPAGDHDGLALTLASFVKPDQNPQFCPASPLMWKETEPEQFIKLPNGATFILLG